MIRIPVLYKGLQLMPMKASKARRLISSGEAKLVFDRKINMHVIKLKFEPSGYATQEIVLGIDTGSTFDGYTILSKKYHHLNVELIHRVKSPVKNKSPKKNSIKSFKVRQAMNRRIRRSRLRHRPIRFNNRTGSFLAPTIRADIDFRKWLITKLSSYFPITKVIVEDVRFNHYRDLVGKNRLSGKARGAPFSQVEVGKIYFYNWLIDSGYTLEFTEGYNTKEARLQYLGTEDTKSMDKSEKSFEAHCLDSFVIAGKYYNLKEIELNKSVIFIEKIVKQRRSTLLRAKYKDACKYFRYSKGGEKVYFEAKSNKLSRCRVKPEGIHSNHPKQWEYIDNGYAIKKKCLTQKNGTVKNGVPKYFVNNEWNNRKISVVLN